MRLGIIGGGGISETHARAASGIPGLTVAAVYGGNRARTSRLASEYGAAAFDDFDRFLAHPLDLVAIGSPSGLHAEQGIAAAGRGLHVLVEKPLDITVDRADALIAAADAAGVKLGLFFQDRLRPDILRLKSMLDDGVLSTRPPDPLHVLRVLPAACAMRDGQRVASPQPPHTPSDRSIP